MKARERRTWGDGGIGVGGEVTVVDIYLKSNSFITDCAQKGLPNKAKRLIIILVST